MIEIVSDNIISSFGFSTDINYQAVKAGRTSVEAYPDLLSSGVGTAASYIGNKVFNEVFADFCMLDPDHYSKVEKAVMLSVKMASQDCNVDLSCPDTAFYLASTKGNVHYLDLGDAHNPAIPLWHTAKRVAKYFGNSTTPVVVSNACISGLSAIIAAARALESGRIRCAVVSGVDMLSKFVILGFSSLKALSAEPCRPFDINRNGLNLGEAAATVILQRADSRSKLPKFVAGFMRNDAYHISSPSKTAEGSFHVLSDVLKYVKASDVAFVNAHGTSTLYNDEMEAVAIARAGLDAVPVNSLKGCFGHTLGAAGILESIISVRALQDGTVLKTIGFGELGVSKRINVAAENTATDKKYFIKLISGFGGSNSAALFKKGE